MTQTLPSWLPAVIAGGLATAAGWVVVGVASAVVDWLWPQDGQEGASAPASRPQTPTGQPRRVQPLTQPHSPRNAEPKEHPVTLAELRAQLDALNLPDDTLVVLAKDGEGNGHSPLVEAEHAMYLADSTYSGERYLTHQQRAAEADPDDYSEAPDDAVPAVFLWPTN